MFCLSLCMEISMTHTCRYLYVRMHVCATQIHIHGKYTSHLIIIHNIFCVCKYAWHIQKCMYIYMPASPHNAIMYTHLDLPNSNLLYMYTYLFKCTYRSDCCWVYVNVYT